MNTKTVQKTAVRNLPVFPDLTGDKRTRVITKHFTNLALWLPTEELSLITWLIYDSKVDNSVEYSTQLLTRYGAAIKAACKMYGPSTSIIYHTTLRSSLKANRGVFKTLIEKGLLLPTFKEKTFIINPMLYYRPEYMRPKEYKQVTEAYQRICADDRLLMSITNDYLRYFSDYFMEVVKKYLDKKKA